MKKFALIMSYLLCFLIGCYTAAEMKFNFRVEDYRWTITIFCFLFFLMLAHRNNVKVEK